MTKLFLATENYMKLMKADPPKNPHPKVIDLFVECPVKNKIQIFNSQRQKLFKARFA